ncbi:MAG: hypothetical protein AAGC68_11985, partial [Verrucomicrobiota bacterium]
LRELLGWIRQAEWEGPIGIDSYLYRSPGGRLSHRVLCEINPRYTMGRVAHEIRRQVSAGCGVRFEIFRSDRSISTGQSEQTNGRISGGTVVLTEKTNRSTLAAKITVAKNRADLYAFGA